MRRAAVVACMALAACATSTSTTPPPAPSSPAPRAKIAPLHLAGDAPAAPASLGPPGTIVHPTYHVCLEADGSVRSVATAPGLAAVDEAAVTALRGWSWFVVSNDTRPCFDVTLDLAVPVASRILRQATTGVVAQLKHGVAPALPTWVVATNAGKIVDAAYKVCVGDDGVVASVRPLASLVGGLDALGAALRASTWDVIVGPLAQAPYCFAAPVRIDLTHTTAPPFDAAPSLPMPATPPHAAPGRSILVQTSVVPTRAMPHLSDRLKIALARAAVRSLVVVYALTYDATGAVIAVDPIRPIPEDDPAFVAALRSWNIALSGPPGVGVRSFVKLEFTINSRFQ